MKVYAVKILDTAFADIDKIAEFVVSVSTPEHAVKYVHELQAEIMSLRYLAGIIPESRYQTGSSISSMCKTTSNSEQKTKYHISYRRESCHS